MTELTIKALKTTYLKKSTEQSSTLPEDKKVKVKKGKVYGITEFREIDLHASGDHLWVSLTNSAGIWCIYQPHWKCSWIKKGVGHIEYPEWDQVNWLTDNWDTPISRFFTLGEACNYSNERRPSTADVQKNIITIARKVDEVRDWWGSGLACNSWYRPEHVNARVGGATNSRHIQGDAIDVRPLQGSIYDLQNRFKSEWFNTGKWQGGFGLGANKGFIHLDNGTRRTWNY